MSLKIDLKNINKSNWIKYQFDQIAEKISETVDPKNTDLNIYVGLEHLDANNIHIRKYGKPSEVIGNKLRCYPGDVIFGKRRAYLRKAAVINFNGICSAHSFVLRSKSEAIDSKLFPFFIHSDSFMHQAINISVGGLSPTINWRHLKKINFLLPPKKEQPKLTELLSAIDEVVQQDYKVYEEINKLYLSFSNDVFRNKSVKNINDVAEIISGSFGDDSGKHSARVLGVSSIKEEGEIDFNKYHERFFNDKEFSKYLLKEGDLIMAKSSGNSNNIISGRVSIYDKTEQNHIASNFTFRIRPKKKDTLKLFHAIYCMKSQSFIKKLAVGSTYPNLTLSDIHLFKVYIPSDSENKKLTQLFLKKKEVSLKIEKSKFLQKALINKVFDDI